MKALQRFERSWFHDPGACVVVPGQLAVVVVHGCGATFTKRVAYAHRYGSWVRHAHEVHALVGRSTDSPFLVPLADLDGQGLHRVAVWRDPVERFSATYARWCEGPTSHPYARFAGLSAGVDRWRFLRFIEWEFGKSDPSDMVEELRPQSASWQPEQVDEVVGVEDLVPVLRRFGARPRPRSRPVRPVAADVPVEVARKVQQLYAADYALVGRELPWVS